ASVLRTAATVPWALAAIEAFDGPFLVAVLGVLTALIVLGGHPQVVAYALALLVLYAAWFGRIFSGRRGLDLGAGLVLGIGVAAGSWLPALELAFSSTRSLGVAPGMEIPPLALDQLDRLVAPFAQGRSLGPLYGTTPGILPWLLTETTGYPGMIVWLLAAAGLPGLLRDRHGRFWLAIALAALLLATGLVQAVLPIPGMRAPARLLLWWNVAAAALAARALEARPSGRALVLATAAAAGVIAWTATPAHAAPRAALGSGLVLAVAALALFVTFARGRGSEWLALALAADLIAFDASLVLGMSSGEFASSERDLTQLRAGLARLPASEAGLARSISTPNLAMANWAALEEIPVLQGFSSLVPLPIAYLLGHVPSSIEAAELGTIRDASLVGSSSHVLDLLRLRLVASNTNRLIADPLGRAIEDSLTAGEPRWERLPVDVGPRFRFYLNRRARPVAWLVARVRVVPAERALAILRGTVPGDGFDPAIEALSEAPIAGLGAPAATNESPRDGATPDDAGGVEVARYLADEVRLEAHARAPALLVTSDLDYPGWSATVDGRPVPVHVVNYAFRSVVVPAGDHPVVLSYRPGLGRAGLATSLASAVVLAGYGLASRRAQRTR
ncbi:MAG TPA: YfhO family protein, partial [Candidatus Bathyarchaeia archaeon]|nr:YfhO family protein [Candidatus Bathyarchaeia archaeon]